MHFVVFDIFFFHRTEGSETDFQLHFGDVYAFGGNLGQQFFGKVKPRRRCRHRTGNIGVNRLIPLHIAVIFLDIRRKRHGADAIQQFFPDAFIIKTDDASAAFGLIQNFRRDPGNGKVNHIADPYFFPGSGKDLPNIPFQPFQQKKLDFRAGFFLPEETGGNDFCFIENKNITGTEIFDHIGKDPVFQRIIGKGDMEKTAVIAVFRRTLSDQLRRQMVIEFF